jgi:hypothetical protein
MDDMGIGKERKRKDFLDDIVQKVFPFSLPTTRAEHDNRRGVR